MLAVFNTKNDVKVTWCGGTLCQSMLIVVRQTLLDYNLVRVMIVFLIVFQYITADIKQNVTFAQKMNNLSHYNEAFTEY